MTLTWNRHDVWLAVFDVLGFRHRINEVDQDFPRALLTNQLLELLDSLESDAKAHGRIEYLVFADTIVVSAPTLEPRSYPWFLLQCQTLMRDFIRIRLPLRGAIAAGTAFAASEWPIMLGPAFVEANTTTPEILQRPPP